ncbi:DUF3307 domain-containing protein [Halomonas sp. PAMB 3264]|uniref:DUF3307 domain-containing protein n=1 Tax=Halomonas sp. PAMB 3264 TaxID=3075222 RepID=UPI0028A17126|nr:DUF3307 domain-containing protein [Halomonas sp. PAMB 3264]WNL42983.1 DUF3307 domain-containing protein [Halomonas sp. PAMB 3264]
MVSLVSLCTLYIAFVLKHFIADYLLQTRRIAEAKANNSLPLVLLHVSGHGLGTLLIVLFVAPSLWWLSLIDLLVHLCIDLGKSAANRRLGLTPSHTPFWWLLGADQALHQLTHFVLIIVLLTAM